MIKIDRTTLGLAFHVAPTTNLLICFTLGVRCSRPAKLSYARRLVRVMAFNARLLRLYDGLYAQTFLEIR